MAWSADNVEQFLINELQQEPPHHQSGDFNMQEVQDILDIQAGRQSSDQSAWGGVSNDDYDSGTYTTTTASGFASSRYDDNNNSNNTFDDGNLDNIPDMSQKEAKEVYDETHLPEPSLLDEKDDDENNTNEKKKPSSSSSAHSASSKLNFPLGDKISFATKPTSVEMAILEGTDDLSSYVDSVFKKDPFSLTKIQIRNGPVFFCLPHHIAALCGNVFYLKAMAELIKTEEDVKEKLSLTKLKKHSARVRNFIGDDKELLLSLVKALQTNANKASTSNNNKSKSSSSPAQPPKFPLQNGLQLLNISSPESKRSLSEFAARGGHADTIMKWMNQPEINLLHPILPNNNGDVPLFFAVQEGNIQALEYFHKNCADCNLEWKCQDNEETLLHCAAANTHPDCVEFLLNNSKNAVDALMLSGDGTSYETPVSAACCYAKYSKGNNGIKCIELLWERGGFEYCLKEQKLCSRAATMPVRLEDALAAKKRLELLHHHKMKGCKEDDNDNGNDENEDKILEEVCEHSAMFLKFKGFPVPFSTAEHLGFKSLSPQDLDSKTDSLIGILHGTATKTTNDNEDKASSSAPTLRQIIRNYLDDRSKRRPEQQNKEQNGASSSSSAAASSSIVEGIYTLNKSKPRAFYTSPVHCACSRGATEVVKWLCEKGFAEDLNVKAPNTCLYECIRSENGFETAKYLIDEKRVSLDEFNEGDEKFSHVYGAAYLGRKDILRHLLMRGANSSLACSKGATPVFASIFGGQIECLKVLLEFNVDMSTSYSGFGVLNYAKSLGSRADIVQLLEKHL